MQLPRMNIQVELTGDYSYVNSTPCKITSQNFNGGGGALFITSVHLAMATQGHAVGTGWPYLKDNYGYAGSASGNAFTYMFGPQIKKHSGKFQPLRGSVGSSHGKDVNHSRTMAAPVEVARHNDGFAMEFGGGLDSKHGILPSKWITSTPTEQLPL